MGRRDQRGRRRTLRAVIERHGPQAVAAYVGNPSAFNTLAGPASGSFFAQLGMSRYFSSGTQDCANKFAGSEAVFGSSTIHPIPDIANTDALLVLGANPRVSKGQLHQHLEHVPRDHAGVGPRCDDLVRQPATHGIVRGAHGGDVADRPGNRRVPARRADPRDRCRSRLRSLRRRPWQARRRAAGVRRRVLGRHGRSDRRDRRGDHPRRGDDLRHGSVGRRCTCRRASTWAVTERSPTGSCTC